MDILNKEYIFSNLGRYLMQFELFLYLHNKIITNVNNVYEIR